MFKGLKGFKKVLSLVVVLILLVGTSVYAQNESETYKIGVILPLTGRAAFLGNSVKNGLILAANEINKPEEKLKLIFEDTKGMTKESVSAANKLINIDKVLALFTYPSAPCEAVLPIAKNHKVLQVSITMTPAHASKSEYTFNIFPTADQEVIVMTEHVKRMRPKKVGILYVVAPAHEQVVNGDLIPRLKSLGYQDKNLHIETFKMADRDIRNQMLKLKDFGADLIIVFIYPPLLDQFFKTYSQSGLVGKARVLGNMGFTGKMNIAPEITEGTIFTAPPHYFKQTKKITIFLDRYHKVFNSFPEPSNAFFAYDALHILYRCLSSAKGDIEKARQFLSKIREYDGITGKIEILPSGNVKIDIGLGVIKEGKLAQYNE